MPTEVAATIHSDSTPPSPHHERANAMWFWIVMGVLIPPIGLLALLVYVARVMTDDRQSPREPTP
jgi:hypothetical protein